MAARQKSRAENVREDIRTRLEEQSFLFRGVFVGKKKSTSAQIDLIFFFFFHLEIAQCGEISLRAPANFAESTSVK